MKIRLSDIYGDLQWFEYGDIPENLSHTITPALTKFIETQQKKGGGFA